MNRLALALLATTFLTAPAHAEPISAVIGLTALISSIGVSAAVAGAIGGAIVSTAISVGISLAASALKGGNEPTDGTAPTRSGTTLNVQYGAGLPRSARMGPGATGGHHVYTNVFGPENKVLQCVFVIGDGQHGKLTRLKYNGKDCTLPPFPVGDVSAQWILPEFHDSAGNPHVVVRYFNGRYDQVADSELVANANPAGRWTTDHRGRGVAYVSINQFYNEELGLTGVPQILVETEGLALYDPRLDSTNGGSGAMRWGLPDTYLPSANPAIQEYNFRRGILVNGQRLLGMAISPVNLLLQMYFTAANINDEAIPLAEGGTEKRYRCSIEVNDARSNADVLSAIRGATAGWSLERGGQFGPIPGVPQIPVSSLAFTDDDLIVGERATFTKYRSRTDLITAAHGSFSDPAQFWANAAFPARQDPADDAAIGEKLARDFDLSQVYSSSQAQRIAESERRRTLQQGQGTVTLPAKWIGVQPGDWLTYNSQRHGNMTVLVTSVQLDVARHLVTLTYERTSNSVYSWTTAGELFPPDVGAGGVPGFIIMSATGMIATGVNIPGDNGLVTPGIHFAWDPIFDPSVDQIDFEIRKVGDTGVLPFTADFPSSGSAVCSGNGIQAATNYEYRHKLYTTPVRDTPWSGWATVTSGTQHLVPGAITSIPGDVTLASFEQGLRDYVANQLSASMAEVDRIEQLIANEAAEQDAHNWLEKLAGKEADVAIKEQVGAQFGTTWRGDWDAFTQYQPGDQVRYSDGKYYWTDATVIGTAPPADPWMVLLNTAVISEGWRTFAGDDGVAAQTSMRIEARFQGVTVEGTPNDLPIGVSQLIQNWGVFAGPTYAAAQTSTSIESRFGSATPTQSLATVSSEWKTFAGDDSAGGSTRAQITASIGGHTISINQNATAIANIDGTLAGTWQVTIDAYNYISGIKLYGTATTSQFIVLTDTFLIAKPGLVNDPVPKPVFEVATNQYGTAAKLVLKGDIIADGTITAGALVAGSVTAIKIAASAITTDKIAVGGVDILNIIDGAVGLRQTVATNAISGTSGNNNLVGQVSAEIKNTTRVVRVYLSIGNVDSTGGPIGSAGAGTFVLRCLVDGGEQGRQNYTHDSGTGGFSGTWRYTKIIQTFFEVGPLSAAVHTFQIFMDASGTTTAFPAGKMTVEEFRR